MQPSSASTRPAMRPASRRDLRRMLRIGAITAAAFLAVPGFALPEFGLQSEDAIARIAGLREQLGLTANQRILWQQVESRSRELIRERQLLRNRTHQETRAALADARIELRLIANRLNASNDEEARIARQIQEQWLTLDEALDDNQRKVVREFLVDLLARGDAAADPRPSQERPPDRGDRRSREGRPPGGGSPGGGGMGGGYPR